MRQAVKRTDHLAKERLENTHPTIPRGKRFWPLADEQKREIERIFPTKEVGPLVTALRTRRDDAGVEVLDAAYWMKGCSSLGRLGFAVLLGVGKSQAKEGGLCLTTSRKLCRRQRRVILRPRFPSTMPRASSKALAICRRPLAIACWRQLSSTTPSSCANFFPRFSKSRSTNRS
jgi:hypothetical protein